MHLYIHIALSFEFNLLAYSYVSVKIEPKKWPYMQNLNPSKISHYAVAE